METAVDRRIAFINPFGTAAFDAIIEETLVPYAANGTSVDVIHLEGVPANIDYYYPKHLMELAIFDEVRRLEERGYDAVVVGCCYDPGVRVARELVDIPVVGPLEAAMNHASYFGHSFTVVTDHAKARPWLEDLVRLHGAGNCRGVRFIDWYVTDMIEDTTAVADDAAAACLTALKEDQAEVVILGCTIIGGCLEREIMTTGRHRDLPILNPNLFALKAAETLADLHRMGKYNDQPGRPLPAPRAARPGRGRGGPAALSPRRSGCRGGRFVTVATTTVADIAGRVVRDYLAIARGERFAIVVDDRTDVEIPAELARAALAAGGDPIVVTIAPRARSGAEPPAPAAAAMAAADVVLCAASTSLYHTAAKAAAQRAGRSRRVQRPVPGRCLADRRDDRRLRRDPAPRGGAGGACGGGRARSASPPRPARICERR